MCCTANQLDINLISSFRAPLTFSKTLEFLPLLFLYYTLLGKDIYFACLLANKLPAPSPRVCLYRGTFVRLTIQNVDLAGALIICVVLTFAAVVQYPRCRWVRTFLRGFSPWSHNLARDATNCYDIANGELDSPMGGFLWRSSRFRLGKAGFPDCGRWVCSFCKSDERNCEPLYKNRIFGLGVQGQPVGTLDQRYWPLRASW